MRDSKESSVKIVPFSGMEIYIWGTAEGNSIPKINAT